MKVAITSNGNAFSTLMVRPLFAASDVDVVGAVVVRVPPGRGGRVSRLWRLSRRTGVRYAAHKVATLGGPSAYGLVTRRPVFLDQLCRRHGVPVLPAASANEPSAVEFLRGPEPDVLLSVSTPERLDAQLLEIPRVAAINVHWALLPRYAGIAPYFWVLRNGEASTGVTVHVMAPELDVGPVLRQREVPVRPDDTSLSLQLRLVEAGGAEILTAIRSLPGALDDARAQDLSSRSYFSWPTPGDVAALRRGRRRLARASDHRRLLRMLGSDDVDASSAADGSAAADGSGGERAGH